MQRLAYNLIRIAAGIAAAGAMAWPIGAIAKNARPMLSLPAGWSKSVINIHGMKILMIRSGREENGAYPTITLRADPWPLAKSIAISTNDLARDHIVINPPSKLKCSNHRTGEVLTWEYRSIKTKQIFMTNGPSTAIASYSRAARTPDNADALATLYSMCMYPTKSI